MSMNDILSDTITRIRNAQRAGLEVVQTKDSKLVRNVLEVLSKEGYIAGFEKSDKAAYQLEVKLKYYEGNPVIKEISRVSKPGRRSYMKIGKMPTFYNGLGIAILSTSKGVVSDYEARQANVGGEILCSVF